MTTRTALALLAALALTACGSGGFDITTVDLGVGGWHETR